MKKIAVCYKWVLSDTEIRVNEKSRELDLEKCKGIVNEYDRNGLEVGVQLKAASGAELVGVTAGKATAASTKDALSRGLDIAYYLEDPIMETADSTTTSKVLAGLIKKIGDVDVIICSEASSDEYAQQTGFRLASLLGYPSVSYVSKVTASGDTLSIERKLDDGTEELTINTPVVLTIIPEVCEAPIPSVKQILGAKKKPSQAITLADAGIDANTVKPLITTNSVKAPVTSRKSIQMNPEGVSLEEAVGKLVKQLSADGVL